MMGRSCERDHGNAAASGLDFVLPSGRQMSRPTPLPVRAGPSRRAAACHVRLRVAALWIFGVLLAPRPALAAGPETAELDYTRPAELSACPDEAAFRQRVVERMGRNPFAVGASRKIQVLFTRAGATLTALVRVEDAGKPRGERRIETRAGCEELASGAALAVSIAIDPLAALGAPNPPEAAAPAPPSPPPKPEAPSAEPQKTAAPARPARAVRAPEPPATVQRWFVRGQGRAWLGAVPGVGEGLSLGLGFRRDWASLGLDGSAVLPRTQSVPRTRRAVAVTLLGAQLSPCAHFAALRGCALFASGALFARGEGVDNPRTAMSYYAAAGVGLGYAFFSGRFTLTPTVEASARLATAQLSLDDQPVWNTPRLLGSLGLELAYDFAR